MGEGASEAGALELTVADRVGPTGEQVCGETDPVGQFGESLAGLPARDAGGR